MKSIRKLIIIIFITFIFGVIINSIVNPYIHHNDVLRNSIPYVYLQLYSVLVLGGSILFILFFVKNKKISYMHIKKVMKDHGRTIFLLHSIIYLCIMLIFTHGFEVNPSWDFGFVYNRVGKMMQSDFNYSYFNIYPNNLFLLFFEYGYARIFGWSLLNFQLLNIFMIWISLIGAYFFIYKQTQSNVKAYFGFIVISFFLPLLLYSPIFYSDTLSLPFIIFPLLFLFDKGGEVSRRISSIFIGSSILAIGYLMKPPLIIYVIAIVIVVFISLKNWQKTYALIPIGILIVFSSLFSFSVDSQHIFATSFSNTGFPVTHWIAMGQYRGESYGWYSEDEVNFAYEVMERDDLTRQEKTILFLQRAILRIQERTLFENINFYLKKHAGNWGDSTYYSLNKLQRKPVNPQFIENLCCGTSGYIMQVFMDFYQKTVYLLLLIGSIVIFKAKKIKPFYLYTSLSAIGFSLFFIMWEGRSRYIFPVMIPLIILAVLYFFEIRKYNRKFSKKATNRPTLKG